MRFEATHRFLSTSPGGGVNDHFFVEDVQYSKKKHVLENTARSSPTEKHLASMFFAFFPSVCYF